MTVSNRMVKAGLSRLLFFTRPVYKIVTISKSRINAF